MGLDDPLEMNFAMTFHTIWMWISWLDCPLRKPNFSFKYSIEIAIDAHGIKQRCSPWFVSASNAFGHHELYGRCMQLKSDRIVLHWAALWPKVLEIGVLPVLAYIGMSQSQATVGSSCATLQDGLDHLDHHKDEQALLKELQDHSHSIPFTNVSTHTWCQSPRILNDIHFT